MYILHRPLLPKKDLLTILKIETLSYLCHILFSTITYHAKTVVSLFGLCISFLGRATGQEYQERLLREICQKL
jgi:hypothetical protein